MFSYVVKLVERSPNLPSNSTFLKSSDLCTVWGPFVLMNDSRGCVVAVVRPLRKRITTTCMAQVFKTRTSRDEEKEGSLWLIRLQEHRTRVP